MNFIFFLLWNKYSSFMSGEIIILNDESTFHFEEDIGSSVMNMCIRNGLHYEVKKTRK
jgi:hypothetical protein